MLVNPNDCVACARWRAKIDAKRNKTAWNANGKGPQEVAGLADTLRTEATKTVVNEMKKILADSVAATLLAKNNAQQALDKANAEYKTALEAKTVFDKTFDDILAAAPAKKLDYYYLASRTGGKGHYMSVEQGTANITCTCEAAQYGNKCWAQDAVYRAQRINKENFDARKLGYVTPVSSW